jgi:hypothetical protein
MMRLQCADISVISAERATSAGVGYKRGFQFPAMPSDAFGSAPLASIAATGLEEERGSSVAPADQFNRYQARLSRHMAPTSAGFQFISPQPVADGRLASAKFRHDLSDRQPVIHQPLQPLSLDPTSRRVLLRVRRGEPVLVHPIRHRRRSLPNRLAIRSTLSRWSNNSCSDSFSTSDLPS